MKPQDNESSLASGNTLHDSTMETSSKPHDSGTRRPRQSGSKERKQCVCQSRRKNTAEMSKSESTIEEKDYLQTCTVSPSTSIASSIETEDIELYQLEANHLKKVFPSVVSYPNSQNLFFKHFIDFLKNLLIFYIEEERGTES